MQHKRKDGHRLVAALERAYRAQKYPRGLAPYDEARLSPRIDHQDDSNIDQPLTPNLADPVSDDEAAWWRESARWGC